MQKLGKKHGDFIPFLEILIILMNILILKLQLILGLESGGNKVVVERYGMQLSMIKN